MPKFTKFEQYIINQALDLWVEQFQKEIQSQEASGQTPIFHISYPSQLANDVRTTVASLTKKK